MNASARHTLPFFSGILRSEGIIRCWLCLSQYDTWLGPGRTCLPGRG